MRNPITFPSQKKKKNFIQTAHHKKFDKTVSLLIKNSSPFQSSIFVKQNRRYNVFWYRREASRAINTFDLLAGGRVLLIPRTGNGARGTGNGERGTGHGARGTGHGAWSTGHGARGTGHGARGTGHGARGTGHGARGTGHGARGTGHGARGTGPMPKLNAVCTSHQRA